MIVLQRSAASRSPLPATTTIPVSSSIVEHRMLTNLAVKAARPKAAAYKLTDGGGLHLYVAPTPRWTWRWRFRIAGKEQLLTLGSWPEMSLDQARAARDQARERLDRGEDPREVGTGDDPRLRAFEYVGRRWHAHMRPRWTPVHARDVMASLERDVFPAIGAMPIEGITVPVVLNALRVIQERGSLETSHRVRQRISAVFCYAMADGLVDKDPAAIVGKVLAPPAPTRHKAALIEIEDVRALLAAADRLAGAGDVIVLASRFLALTAVRLAAMRGARWEEIEDLDGPLPQWRVPAARMKLAAAKKLDPANDHIVPLSRQAVELLQRMRANLHCDDANPHGLIFEAGPGRMISEGAIGALYNRAGFAGRHVPHGWRASFSTILNELCRADRGAIDKALGHAGNGKAEQEEGINRKVEAAYNRAAQLAPRRRLFQAWADAVDG
jgi:integrase